MIPSDVLSRLRLTADSAVQQTAPAQKLSDVLSDLVPGQRLMAQIQALLPNGSYRATVAQREIVLALPFAAKSGDTLELEVQESEGKLTLAFIGKQATGTEPTGIQDSVASKLSRTGQMIAELLPKAQGKEGQAKPVPLNAAAPLLPTPPQSATEIAPVLKQAIAQSGMFYEAHQAQWVNGSLPKEALFAEPQGKFSAALLASQGNASQPATLPSTPVFTDAEAAQSLIKEDSAQSPAKEGVSPKDMSGSASSSNTIGAKESLLSTQARAASGAETARHPEPSSGPVKPELAPIVQNQLEALATQNLSWQGQIWPGQQMEWQISANPDRKGGLDGEIPESWQTQLKLRFPSLGGVDAVLSLKAGNEIEIAIKAEHETTRHSLRLNSPELMQQLADAGLSLVQFGVGKPPVKDEQVA